LIDPGSSVETAAVGVLSAEDLEKLYAEMLRIRLFEDAAHRLFMQNEIEGSIHLCQGQEAIPVGVCASLEPSDVVVATYRGHGACLAKGADPVRLFAELLGRETGLCGGRAGSMNVIDLANGILGCFAIVGGSIAVATGAALAAQLRRESTVAVAFFGDGAANQAYFHECLNFAGVRRLPVVFACENNQYGEFTPMASVTAGGRIAARADAYGFPGHEVDGNDVIDVRAAAREAVSRARAGEGPTLLECQTYRHKGHSRHDDPRRYRPQEEVEAWLARDPLLFVAGRLDHESVARIRALVEREIEQALEEARAAPPADPTIASTATKEPGWRS
jgi:acetoin:2,6-dichlorophenolindophenol oxidoreductase subunit alpha